MHQLYNSEGEFEFVNRYRRLLVFWHCWVEEKSAQTILASVLTPKPLRYEIAHLDMDIGQTMCSFERTKKGIPRFSFKSFLYRLSIFHDNIVIYIFMYQPPKNQLVVEENSFPIFQLSFLYLRLHLNCTWLACLPGVVPPPLCTFPYHYCPATF